MLLPTALQEAAGGGGTGLIGAGLAIGGAVIGAGLGIGPIGSAAASGIARQPEVHRSDSDGGDHLCSPSGRHRALRLGSRIPIVQLIVAPPLIPGRSRLAGPEACSVSEGPMSHSDGS